jgi:hypothetical protein
MENEKAAEVSTADDHNELAHQHTAASRGLHHDHIAAEALGGHTSDLPEGYYRSMNFIGTVIVSVYSYKFNGSKINTISRPPVWLKFLDIWDGSSLLIRSLLSTKQLAPRQISFGYLYLGPPDLPLVSHSLAGCQIFSVDDGSSFAHPSLV